MKKVLLTIVIILLLIAFGVSAFMVVNYVLKGKEQKEQYNNLSQIVEDARKAAEENTRPSAETKPGETVGSTEETEPGMLPGYAELYEMNPDLVGWIKIEGTEIDYPVMQTPDNKDYYLRRNFFGEYIELGPGCIYAREECDINEPSDNITIYGHNMHNGTMFHDLNLYIEKEAWDNNSLIFFDTLTEYHTYKIFAVFKTTASIDDGFRYHHFVDADDEQEFNTFVNTCKELAFYDTGVTPVYGDKLICLSTCEYTQTNGRLVVAAVRIS